MSSNEHRQRTAVGIARWLEPHRDVFLDGLGKRGYAPSTIRYYGRVTGSFCREIALLGLGAEALEESVLAELRTSVPGERTAKERSRWVSCMERFIDHLVDAGVLAPPPARGTPDTGHSGSSEHGICRLAAASARIERGDDCTASGFPEALHGLPLRRDTGQLQ